MRLVAIVLLVWLAASPNANAQRILFIGDSIAGSENPEYIGYAHHLTDLDADFVRANTSAELVDELDNVVDFVQYDVVYWNTGLHSIALVGGEVQESLDVYIDNIEAAVDFLQGEDAISIFRTTTPVGSSASRGRRNELVIEYNAAALNVMNDNGMLVDDMYEFLVTETYDESTESSPFLHPDGTHWITEAQRDLIAPRVRLMVTSVPEPTPLLSLSLTFVGTAWVRRVCRLRRS